MNDEHCEICLAKAATTSRTGPQPITAHLCLTCAPVERYVRALVQDGAEATSWRRLTRDDYLDWSRGTPDRLSGDRMGIDTFEHYMAGAWLLAIEPRLGGIDSCGLCFIDIPSTVERVRTTRDPYTYCRECHEARSYVMGWISDKTNRQGMSMGTAYHNWATTMTSSDASEIACASNYLNRRKIYDRIHPDDDTPVEPQLKIEDTTMLARITRTIIDRREYTLTSPVHESDLIATYNLAVSERDIVTKGSEGAAPTVWVEAHDEDIVIHWSTEVPQ